MFRKDKQVKKLLILVLVFMAVSVHAQGIAINDTVLVFKVTAAFNPWVDYHDPNKDTADWVGKESLTAYLIVEVNDANKMVLDNGDDLILIVYGRYGEDLFDVDFDKWYWVSETTIENHLAVNPFDVESDGNGVFWSADFGIDGLSTRVYGKNTKNVAISATVKVALAKTLKGNIVCEDAWLIGGSGYNDAVGSITLTLDSVNTKYANKQPDGQVFLVYAKIIDYLQSKNYHLIP
jgi:hypothetical protein